MKSDETHQVFLERLRKSGHAVALIAHHYRKAGYEVKHGEFSEAKRPEDWMKHKDDGDLYVRPVSEPEFQRIEVKGLGYNWTGAHDWPFTKPQPRYAVCACHSFDMADPKPHAYINLNKARTHAGIVMVASRGEWWDAPLQDGGHGEIQQTYFIDPNRVRFTKL